MQDQFGKWSKNETGGNTTWKKKRIKKTNEVNKRIAKTRRKYEQKNYQLLICIWVVMKTRFKKQLFLLPDVQFTVNLT